LLSQTKTLVVEKAGCLQTRTFHKAWESSAKAGGEKMELGEKAGQSKFMAT